MIRRVLGRLRPLLPARLNRAARGAAFAWGWLTAGLRPPPEIIVVGAQRAGTTTIFRLLSEHPGLVRPTLVKGTGYYDDNYGRGPRWYRAHFPLATTRRGRRAFECSGYYLHHPLAAERIARDQPGVQVVVMVRDPVARAHSAWRHEHARGFDPLDFATAVAAEPERTAGEEELLRDAPGATSFAHRHFAYLRRGEYDEQVARLLAALPVGQVHVVDADALFAAPVPVFVDLQHRLGLPVWVPDRVERWNERPGAPLDPGLEQRLRLHFAPHDAALARLLGQPLTWQKEQLT